jgi:hypothetical protein
VSQIGAQFPAASSYPRATEPPRLFYYTQIPQTVTFIFSNASRPSLARQIDTLIAHRAMMSIMVVKESSGGSILVNTMTRRSSAERYTAQADSRFSGFDATANLTHSPN